MSQPSGRCHCKCKPKTLLQWEGDAPWDAVAGFDNLPEVKAQLERIRDKKNHQVRVFFDDTNADWMANWYISGDHKTTPLPTWAGAGTIRDGIAWGISTPGNSHWGNFPWRMELGCIDCRSCSCSPTDGLIYWPNREQVSTIPIWSGDYPDGRYVSDVTQTTSTTNGAAGRSPTANEISRHHYWGLKTYGKPTETRRCPPEIIVWDHAWGYPTGQNYPPKPWGGTATEVMYGESSADLDVHRAVGFADIHAYTSNAAQRFEDVDLTGVPAIRLTTTMFWNPAWLTAGIGSPLAYRTATVNDITTAGYQAIDDWLDEGGKTLIIDGSSGFGADIGNFIAKFCSITIAPLTYQETSGVVRSSWWYLDEDYNPAATFKFVARDHDLAPYPYTSSTPTFPGASDFTYTLWKTTSGEVLWDVDWWIRNGPTGTFPVAAAETLSSGSRVIVSPFQIITYHDGDAEIPELNFTVYGNVDTGIRSRLNQKPTMDAVSNLSIAVNAPKQTVNLTGITAGGTESQPLRVTASSSDPSLIPNPVVIYTSANSTGSLNFTPVADQAGTATITVTVEDGGLDSDLHSSGQNRAIIRTFDVTVS